MNFLKLGHTKGNNGIKTEDIKEFLVNSRAKLKKIALNTYNQDEISKILNELYDINENISTSQNSPIDNEIAGRLIAISLRMEEFKDSDECNNESKSIIISIISNLTPIKNQFQTQAVSAVC